MRVEPVVSLLSPDTCTATTPLTEDGKTMCADDAPAATDEVWSRRPDVS